MGGSGGGGFSAADRSMLSDAANARLRELVDNSTKILFACEEIDRVTLDDRLGRSKVLPKERCTVVDASEGVDVAASSLDGASVLVTFTDAAEEAEFLNKVIDQGLLRKRRGLHVRNAGEAIIPSKVTAYRWPSMSWNEMEELFS